MGCLVGQHRWADDVTTGKDMIDICFLFSVNRDETRAIDGDAGVFCTNQAAVGLTADRDKHLVELFCKGGAFAFEGNVEPSVCCVDMANPGI